MMKTVRKIASILSVALLIASNAEAVNIVSNGSFETYTGAFGNVISGDGGALLAEGDATLTGWEILTDDIAILQNGNAYNLIASDGTRFLDLEGYSFASLPKGISQSLSGLTIGQQYAFTIDLGISNDDCGGAFCQGPIDVTARIVGVKSQTFTHNDSATSGTIWKSFGFNFTAGATTEVLQIIGISGDNFIGVDNVSVEALDIDPGPVGGTAPEPSALILFASGLVGLAYWRRKHTA